MHAGELLRKWRGKRTQEEAATVLRITQSVLSEYEKGKKDPSVIRALEIEERTAGAVPVESWRKPRSRRAA
jgi:predicted transcriptional regulator